MLHERYWKEADGTIRRRVEEQLELTTWEFEGERSCRRVMREWPSPGGLAALKETIALSARQRATYEQSKEMDGALKAEGLS